MGFLTNYGHSAIVSDSIRDDGLPDTTIVTNNGGNEEVYRLLGEIRNRVNQIREKKCSLGFRDLLS